MNTDYKEILRKLIWKLGKKKLFNSINIMNKICKNYKNYITK